MNLLQRRNKQKKAVPAKSHIKRGDTVMVIAGKHRGETGVVKTVLKDQNKALVEGVNRIKKAVKPNPMIGQQGGIIEVEAPLALSNLMVYDLANSQATRTRREQIDGKRVRVAVKSGEHLDD